MQTIKKYTSLETAVQEICGNSRSIITRKHVSGGDINDAEYLVLDDGTELFMKSNISGFLPCFEAEAEGLEEIRMTGTIKVPEVLGTGTDGSRSFLLLEYISGRRQIWP